MLFRLWVVIISFAVTFACPVLASEDVGTNPFEEGTEVDAYSGAEVLSDPEAMLEIAPLSDDKVLLNSDNELSQPSDKEEKKEAFDNNDPIVVPSKENDDVVIDANKTLTETLKENNQNENNRNFIEGTWVEKLTSSNPLSLLKSNDNDNDFDDGDIEKSSNSDIISLMNGAKKRQKNGKSNAAVFDISGVMLRMTLPQVERTLQNRGFRKVNAKFQIPNFIKWRNEETCRNQGVVGYERLEACVVSMAKKAGHQYLQYLKYAKFDSKEEIEVYFTSNFTENKVYKVFYKSTIASITGNSPKAIYIRNIKIYDFWKKINQKYGQPDNKTTVVWGLGENKPYLRASTGKLLLEDPMFRELDYTRMSREDQRFINSEFYNF